MYTLKFLKSDEFDKLPYKGATTALGVADQNKGVAYVRDNANPLDVFTAFHELEHLKGDDLGEHESPDEDGIYYKGGGSWLQTAAPFLNFIPGIGPALSVAAGAGGTMMANKDAKKAQSQMQSQNMQPTMNQFNPATSMTQGSPAVSAVGGASAGGMGGGAVGGGTIDKVRQLLSQRQSGFYSGRDAGRL